MRAPHLLASVEFEWPSLKFKRVIYRKGIPMADERYSAEMSVTIKNLTTGAEEYYSCDRTGDMSLGGLSKWIGAAVPVRSALEALNKQFLTDDLVP